jgi:hypothetical protein
MGCENCQACSAENFYHNNFPPNTKILVASSFVFPSCFPKAKQKNLVVNHYSSKEKSFFIESSPNEGGREQLVDGKTKCGFWIDRDYVSLKEQHIPKLSKVKIVDPDDDLGLNIDFEDDKENSFQVLGYDTNTSGDNFGCYFLAISDGGSSYDGEDGEWVNPIYLEVIENKKEKVTEVQTINLDSKTNLHEGSSMTNSSLETYFKKAGTRSASRTAIAAVRKGLLRIIKRHYDNQSQDKQVTSNNLKVVQSLLDSPIGQAGLGVLTGFLITKIPKLNEKQEVLDVAEEIIVEGMSVGMDQVIEFGIQNVLPEILPLLEEGFPGAEEIKAMLPSIPIINPKDKTVEKTTTKRTYKKKNSPVETKQEEEVEEVVVDVSGGMSTRKKGK